MPDLTTVLAIVGFAVLAGVVVVAYKTLLPLTVDTSRSGEPDPERIGAVRAGRLLAYGTPGGRIGDMTLTPWMLEVWVYDTGLVVKPRFVPAAAIPRSEIRAVRVTNRIEVDHAARERPSPVIVGVKRDSVLGTALLTLAPE
jgi:hypothetical protein